MQIRPEAWIVTAALALVPAALDLEPFLVGSVAFAADASSADASAAEGGAEVDERYRAGRRALDEQRWQEAVDAFAEVVSRPGSSNDAAWYWKAYAEAKLNKKTEALETVRALRSRFPASRWLDDAEVLELELRGGGEDVALSEDDELKLYALNSLMNAEPARALPLLEKVLREPNTLELKKQALFVLSQTDSPRAGEILLGAAKDAANPVLARHAIEMIGMSDEPGAARSLMEIYRASTNREAKQAVLEALMLAEATGEVLDLARNEKDAELRKAAVGQLGVMDAVAELRQLYRAVGDRETREEILGALGVAGDVEGLAQAAREPGDEELRIHAIQSMGIASEERSRPILLELYSGGSPAIKRAVVESLFIQDDARALIGLFRREKDRELKKMILQNLSLIDDDEARDLMQQILED